MIMPCMLGIMLPSLNRARETANRVKCASNMRSIGQAMLLYSVENNNQYPPRLEDLLLTQEISSEVFVCPSCNDDPAPGTTAQAQAQNLSAGGHLSYIYIPNLNNSLPADAIVLYEPLSNHDNDGCNMLHGDGHIDFYTRAQAEKIIAQLKSGRNPARIRP
jgi:hypothetical protein